MAYVVRWKLRLTWFELGLRHTSRSFQSLVQLTHLRA